MLLGFYYSRLNLRAHISITVDELGVPLRLSSNLTEAFTDIESLVCWQTRVSTGTATQVSLRSRATESTWNITRVYVLLALFLFGLRGLIVIVIIAQLFEQV